MMSDAQLWESNVLRNLRQVSEARGMKFYVNPPREVIPDFLGSYQPDAIAVGPNGGTVIELKHRGSPATEWQLAAIAQRIADHRDWEFRVIYLSPLADETPPIKEPTAEQIRKALLEVEALVKGGHPSMALVFGWAVLESLARLTSVRSEGQGREEFSPVQAVQRLAEEGYIENEEADHLREMARLRNAVVHGDLSTAVPAEQVESLLGRLRAIVSAIGLQSGDN